MFHTTQVLIPPSVQEGTRLPVYNTSPTSILHSEWEEEAEEKQIYTEESKEGNIYCSVEHIDRDDDNDNKNNCLNAEFTYELQFCLEKDLHLRNTENEQNDTSACTRVATTTELDRKFETMQKPNMKSTEYKSSIVELIHQEQVIRGEIVEDAQYMLEAMATWCKESNPTSINTQERATKLRLLQLKLQSRMSQWDYAAHANEEVYLNDGRRAWQTEVAMQTAAQELEQQRHKWRRQEAILFHRAVTFIIVSHDKEFHALCENEQIEWNALCDAEVHDKKEAEHRAWVNFMNSPEQRALAAEKERQEVLKRKKEARQARLHKIQQEKFIHNCHHGRNGQSLFTGPAPQKMCGKCQVRYDETKKCYVSMFNAGKRNTSNLSKAKSTINNATKNAKKENTSTEHQEKKIRQNLQKSVMKQS